METIHIDRFGRVLIPKPIREELNLKPDSTLEMRLVDGEIMLRPKSVGEIVEHDGVFVWTGSDNLEKSLIELIAETRDERNS
jgi:AbrB family looped-hinge helix DNA binding protein